MTSPIPARHSPPVPLRIASWGETALNIPTTGLAELPDSSHAATRTIPNRDSLESRTSERLHNLRPRMQRQTSGCNLDYPVGEYSDDSNAEALSEHNSINDSDNDPKQKKRVGRPIAYKGDPDAPHLTEEERRRLRRRVANRESARRVRNKRQDTMDDLEKKVAVVQSQNQKLMGHIADVELSKSELLGEIQKLRTKWRLAAEQNAKLHARIDTMQHQFAGTSSDDAGAAALSSCRLERPKNNIRASQGSSEDQLPAQYSGCQAAPLPPASSFPVAVSLPTLSSNSDLPALLQLPPAASQELLADLEVGVMEPLQMLQTP